MDAQELNSESLPHELEPGGSLRKCLHCGRWFHNEADAGDEDQPCPERDANLRKYGPERNEE